MNLLASLLYLQLGGAVIAHEHEPPGHCYNYDLCGVTNPYATVEIGLAGDPMRRIHLEIAARHESSISTGRDRGVNSIEARVRWSPFHE